MPHHVHLYLHLDTSHLLGYCTSLPTWHHSCTLALLSFLVRRATDMLLVPSEPDLDRAWFKSLWFCIALMVGGSPSGTGSPSGDLHIAMRCMTGTLSALHLHLLIFALTVTFNAPDTLCLRQFLLWQLSSCTFPSTWCTPSFPSCLCSSHLFCHAFHLFSLKLYTTSLFLPYPCPGPPCALPCLLFPQHFGPSHNCKIDSFILLTHCSCYLNDGRDFCLCGIPRTISYRS